MIGVWCRDSNEVESTKLVSYPAGIDGVPAPIMVSSSGDVSSMHGGLSGAIVVSSDSCPGGSRHGSRDSSLHRKWY